MLRTHTPRLVRMLGLSCTAAAPRARPAAAVRFYSAKPEPAADAANAAGQPEQPQPAGSASAAEQPAAAEQAGAAAAAAAEPAKSEWQAKFEAKDKEAAKLKEAYQRSIADFRNLQKTTEQEVKKSQQFALQKFAKDLIESVDNFDLAIRAYPKEKLETASQDVKEFYQGVVMVQQVLEKTLAKYGIVKVNPLGEQFDPNEHEALYQVPSETEKPGTIIHVDRTGFKLHERVLRAPKVGFVRDSSE